MIPGDDLYEAIMRALRSEHGAIATGDREADEFLASMLVIIRSHSSRFAALVRQDAGFRRIVGETCLEKVVTWMRRREQKAAIEEVMVGVEGTNKEALGVNMGMAAVCCVCLDDISTPGSGCRPVKKTPCNHVFHGDCILNWLLVSDKYGGGGTCPICRFQILSPVAAAS